MHKLKMLGKLLRTIKHLKVQQIIYQIRYKFKKPGALNGFASKKVVKEKPLVFSPLPRVSPVLDLNASEARFCFLNLTVEFDPSKVDWNYSKNGKLWNYNLQYVDFLRQNDFSAEQRSVLLKDLYQALWDGVLPLEPYPASLRIMNGIRFLSDNPGQKGIAEHIYAEITYLSQFLEFHILGNHLLENAFALLMGGAYFSEPSWTQKAEKILRSQLTEQTLQDGAHFELSPMYHQIILFRVLEALDYLPASERFSLFLREIASRMCTWLATISFRNGQIPHFNDSSDGIAFTTSELLAFAIDLKVEWKPLKQLGNSGYRKFQHQKMELIADVHGISPTYQPGHAHADTFSFCLHYDEKAVIVDTGISTYNICERRDIERSTAAHNTVVVGAQNSSEVWSGFRVGRRAKVEISAEDNNSITAAHSGFSTAGVRHQRRFEQKGQSLFIEDKIVGPGVHSDLIAYFHFDQGTAIDLKGNSVLINDELLISFSANKGIQLENYFLCKGYNECVEATVLKVLLGSEGLRTEFRSKA